VRTSASHNPIGHHVIANLFSQDTSNCAVTEYASAEVEQIKSNDVKCEPEVLIKVEDIGSIVNMPEGEENETDTETDSDSESDSDSDDNTGAEDSHHGSLSALTEHDGQQETENTGVVGPGTTEATTSHGMNQFEKYVDTLCCRLEQFFFFQMMVHGPHPLHSFIYMYQSVNCLALCY
jgi:hypothetical protein